MKNSDMKVIAIILSIALFFTIVTSNAVSIASVVMLVKDTNAVASGTANGDVATDDNGGSSDATADNSSSSDSSSSDSSSSSSDSSSSSSDSSSSSSDSSSSSSDSSSSNSGSSSSSSSNSGSSNSSSSNSGSSNSGSSNSGSSNSGSSNSGSSNSGSSSSKPADGQETFNFYKKSVDDIKKNAKVKSFARKEWQEVVSFEMGAASDVVKGLIQGFMKTEDQAEEKVSETAEDIKNRMCPCEAAFSNVKSATTVEKDGKYVVTIVMKDEVTPKKGSNGVAAMATGILYLEDVEDTVKNDKTVSAIVKELRNAKMVYHAYTIKAVMTKDGKFVSIDHETTADLEAEAVIDLKLTTVDLGGKGAMKFVSKFYNFKY